MAYYIKQIEKNFHNHYKYHYLDHMTTVIDIKENYWSFAIDLFSINDFNLPINSLVGDLQLPYQQVSDISFNLASDQSHAEESVEFNKQYCHIYNATFNVDISQNEFFKQDLNNMKMNMSLSLFIDPEAAKAAGEDIKQDDLDPLIIETNEQRWDFVMYYTNTHLINQNALVDNITGYSLPFGNECVPVSRTMMFECNDMSQTQSPINDLVTISSATNFQILVGKIKFTYWIESSLESKTIEKTLEIDRSIKNKINVHLNECTTFDYENNNIIFDSDGVLGFYIPKYSHGYYELELNILQESVVNKFIVKNTFSFTCNNPQPFITIYQKLIKEIDESWKKVTTNDEII